MTLQLPVSHPTPKRHGRPTAIRFVSPVLGAVALLSLVGCENLSSPMAIRLDQGDLIVATCSTDTAISLYASEHTQGHDERDFLIADPITLVLTGAKPIALTEATANELGGSFVAPVLEPGTFVNVSMALKGGGSRSSSFLIPEEGLPETLWLTPRDSEVSDPCS